MVREPRLPVHLQLRDEREGGGHVLGSADALRRGQLNPRDLGEAVLRAPLVEQGFPPKASRGRAAPRPLSRLGYERIKPGQPSSWSVERTTFMPASAKRCTAVLASSV